MPLTGAQRARAFRARQSVERAHARHVDKDAVIASLVEANRVLAEQIARLIFVTQNAVTLRNDAVTDAPSDAAHNRAHVDQDLDLSLVSEKSERREEGDLTRVTLRNDSVTERNGEKETEAPLKAPQGAVRSETRATNATADGAFGLAVAAFADGVRSVTGVPFAPPRAGAELQKLVGAIVAHCPNVAERVDWSGEAGAAYARAYRGQRIHTHGFVDWLNSGRVAPAPTRNPYEQKQGVEPDGTVRRTWVRKGYCEADHVPLKARDGAA